MKKIIPISERITPLVFKAYPVFRVRLKNISNERLIEGEEYDCVLQAIPYDPEEGNERLIALFPVKVSPSENRGFYRVKKTSKELFEGFAYLGDLGVAKDSFGNVIEGHGKRLREWLSGVLSIWDERDKQYKIALDKQKGIEPKIEQETKEKKVKPKKKKA